MSGTGHGTKIAVVLAVEMTSLGIRANLPAARLIYLEPDLRRSV